MSCAITFVGKPIEILFYFQRYEIEKNLLVIFRKTLLEFDKKIFHVISLMVH